MYYVFLNIETTGNIRVPFGQIAHLVSPDMQKTSLSPVFNSRRHGGGGQSDSYKFLFLDRLPKALAQLFFVY